MTENIDSPKIETSETFKTILIVALSTAAIMALANVAKKRILEKMQELSDQKLIDNINANIANIIND